jgi:hypothetical protein
MVLWVLGSLALPREAPLLSSALHQCYVTDWADKMAAATLSGEPELLCVRYYIRAFFQRLRSACACGEVRVTGQHHCGARFDAVTSTTLVGMRLMPSPASPNVLSQRTTVQVTKYLNPPNRPPACRPLLVRVTSTLGS